MKKLSFVIPCFRSAKTVGRVVNEIIQTVEKDARYDYEIICVNDHSPDNTLEVLLQLAENNHVKVVDLMRNFGQHSALMAGYNFVSGDYVVSMDDDGQNPPSEIFKLVDTLTQNGYDWVSAKYVKKQESLFRRFGSRVAKYMSHVLIDAPSEIDINSYCVIRREIVEEIVKYKNSYPFVHGLMLRVTRNIGNVEINHYPRMEGKSGYSLSKLISLTLNGFTAFSVKPLRAASALGIVIAFIGFVHGVIIVIRKFMTPSVPLGYSSMMAALLFIGGILMILLGLLGEYVGRIYISINNAPQFVVRGTKNMDRDNYSMLEFSIGKEADIIERRLYEEK